MDDLFRKAGENYPLNTGQGNWESIEKRIAVAAVPPVPQKPERKNNYKKLLLLLLFTAISLLIGFMILNPFQKNYKTNSNGKETNQKADLAQIPVTKDINKLTKEIKEANSIVTPTEKYRTTQQNIQSKRNRTFILYQPNSNPENVFLKKDPSSLHFNNYQNKNNSSHEIQLAQESGNKEKNQKVKRQSLFTESQNRDTTLKNKPKSEGNKDILSTEKKKKSSITKPVNDKGFYAGVMAGADFSKVHSGPFSSVGFNSSFLAGYKINKIFFETGLSSATKYYYSEGKAFNEKGASMPDGMKVNNLESRSKILEIPIKAGYYFYQKKKTNLFISGGVATYIMTNEKNNYNVTMNGSPEKMEGLYTKNNLKMPAVFSISAGVEKNISGLIKIRIEPYLKLPLQGIGVGKLPVTSAGIQIGITGRLK